MIRRRHRIGLGVASPELEFSVVCYERRQGRPVKHIKGLEFEAVFFVGIDKLAKIYPNLFDKYFYVGATPAASYLGLICERNLPPGMAGFEDAFGRHWE